MSTEVYKHYSFISLVENRLPSTSKKRVINRDALEYFKGYFERGTSDFHWVDTFLHVFENNMKENKHKFCDLDINSNALNKVLNLIELITR